MQPDTHETPDAGAPGEPAELARREALLDAIGGEPLAGSGFDQEEPDSTFEGDE